VSKKRKQESFQSFQKKIAEKTFDLENDKALEMGKLYYRSRNNKK